VFGLANAVTNASGPGFTLSNGVLTFSTNGWQFAAVATQIGISLNGMTNYTTLAGGVISLGELSAVTGSVTHALTADSADTATTASTALSVAGAVFATSGNVLTNGSASFNNLPITNGVTLGTIPMTMQQNVLYGYTNTGASFASVNIPLTSVVGGWRVFRITGRCGNVVGPSVRNLYAAPACASNVTYFSQGAYQGQSSVSAINSPNNWICSIACTLTNGGYTRERGFFDFQVETDANSNFVKYVQAAPSHTYVTLCNNGSGWAGSSLTYVCIATNAFATGTMTGMVFQADSGNLTNMELQVIGVVPRGNGY
jgi:hypothetical protein